MKFKISYSYKENNNAVNNPRQHDWSIFNSSAKNEKQAIKKFTELFDDAEGRQLKIESIMKV